MIIFVVILAIIFALLITYLILSSPNSSRKRAGMEKLKVSYAHRGLWNDELPENSVAAFTHAADEGFAIELDVQLSSDGDVVVFHDYDLSRMCGEDTKLSSLRGAELSWRKLKGTEHCLPLFSDVLAAVKGRVPILIELKGETSDTALCEAVAHELAYYDGKVCVQSFNPYLLGWFKKHQPRLARGVLYTDFKKNSSLGGFKCFLLTSMITNVISSPDFISYDGHCANWLPIKLMTKLHKLPAFVWLVKDERGMANCRKVGVCPIFEGFVPEKIGENK